MACLAAAIRVIFEVRLSGLEINSAHESCTKSRDTPRRVLSIASEPQPEPDVQGELFKQLADIDEGFLAWDFSLRDARGAEIASVDRTFRGLGREVWLVNSCKDTC